LLDDCKTGKELGDGRLFVINRDKKMQPFGHYNGLQQLFDDIEWGVEQNLRREEDYRISIIGNKDTREAAGMAETIRQQQWDDAHLVAHTAPAGSAATVTQTTLAVPNSQPRSSSAGAFSSIPPASRNTTNKTSHNSSAPSGQPRINGVNQPSSQSAAQQGNSSTIPPSSQHYGRLRKYLHFTRKENP
jgi:hypothetical protein